MIEIHYSSQRIKESLHFRKLLIQNSVWCWIWLLNFPNASTCLVTYYTRTVDYILNCSLLHQSFNRRIVVSEVTFVIAIDTTTKENKLLKRNNWNTEKLKKNSSSGICGVQKKWMQGKLCEDVIDILGVQVWNADFRQQMVHQSSLCYKDLTPRHFVESSTSVRHARVINWKSVCIVPCCYVLYVEIYTEQKTFTGSINFLFSFEGNCCWIISITSRSLRRTCSIATYV